MKRYLLRLCGIFLCFPIIFLLGRGLFMLINHTIYSEYSSREICAVILHGVPMDLSIAGYLSIIPALLLMVARMTRRKWPDMALKIYFAVLSVVVSCVICLDSALYSYWLCKIDLTPFFYFLSSPASSLASAEWWYYPAGILGVGALSAISYALLRFASLRMQEPSAVCHNKRSYLEIAGMTLATALLIIPIRGGLSVATMNPSMAYFSTHAPLNHAAVNPAFSLLYSSLHQHDFAAQYQYLDPVEAESLFSQLNSHSPASDSLSTPLLSSKRPDIYFIILESFSSHLFPSLGGENVACRLDSIAKSGLLFSNIYASSFRTDRGIPAILSGFPAIPSTSILRFTGKTERLPSLATSLKRNAGYSCSYVYGGDANFTNMRAYLVSSGFDRIISDSDFPVSKRLSKWGAHDDALFEMALSTLEKRKGSSSPSLYVIQTSSSHEPFEVDYDDHGRFRDIRAKAFAFADSCAASFVNSLHKSPRWDNSLIVLLPDHYGAYPDLDNPIDRHKIPVIMTGGALRRKGVISTVASQTDLAASLLAALGLDHSDFRFSNDILDPGAPHYAFFSHPSYMGLVAGDRSVVIDLQSDDIISGDSLLSLSAKAYIQTLYNDIARK